MKTAYEFGPYRLEEAQCRLWRKGQEVSLRPRLFTLLLLLVKHAGQILGREQLMNDIWHDQFIEESNLTVSVKELRKILGGEQYIETITRRGYRFGVPVKVITDVPVPATHSLALHADLEPPGGAMPLHSPWYVARPTDEQFYEALARRDSIVLLKGARQVGKTSLLARGLRRAREAGAKVLLTDFQQLSASAFDTSEKLLLTLAEMMAERLELATRPHEKWNQFLSPSSNFERFLRREVLSQFSEPLVWGMDEVDRLFSFSYASEIFGLFRSWHNMRALDPDEQWNKLTLALAYATEAHLFITDLNQSPFNVGTRLSLEDFTLAHVEDLNQRYGAPLRDAAEVKQFFGWLGGHPYLTQRGLYEMATHSDEVGDLASLIVQAERFEGAFGDHLHRLGLSLERDAELRDALRGVLNQQTSLGNAHFYRLRSAGVLTGGTAQEARLRCTLYQRYFQTRLA